MHASRDGREGDDSTRRPFDLDATLREVAHWLPAQGPIKDFIHHNTLHAFQDRPFHEAVGAAGLLYGARDYLSLSDYRDRYRRGAITASGLDRALMNRGVPPKEREAWERRLLDEAVKDDPIPKGLVASGLRSGWTKTRGVDLDALAHPLFFRLLSSFLDQGISHWRMPHATDNFWNAVGRLVAESRLPLIPLTDQACRALLARDPREAILACLGRIAGRETHYEQYLLEMSLAHPGWSGMIAVLEEKPGALIARRRITLEQAVAVELLLELGWLLRYLGPDFTPLIGSDTPLSPSPSRLRAPETESRLQRRVWHDAMEWSLYEDVLRGLELHRETPVAEPDESDTHAFFCIDDRECSLRRHLEEVSPRVRTYATAGFFGVDILFQAAGESHPTQMCPVVVTPRHLVREIAEPTEKETRPGLRRLPYLDSTSNTLFRGWLLTQTIGLIASFKLALRVFTPGSRLLADVKMTGVDRSTRLNLLREKDERTDEGFWIGFSIPEMIDRVHTVLSTSGIELHRGSRLVVFVAHGSSSANNPHFAAYDCGACAGRPGAPNARAIAWMANHPDVRDGLRNRGLDVPRDCHFLGAIHDTCRDEITYFDTSTIPSSHRPLFERFEASMREALQRNAKERCRRFELVPLGVDPKRALEHVRERASSIFEPRPEMNHATNAIAIVGRRALTHRLFLDRRAFLNSYDPRRDPDGTTLTAILGAVIPVCAGINLEYYFSRVDNSVYGAGTKLPHNVFGLVGVANGVEGDLQTGLPSQMVEIHDPVRLLVVVEQEPRIALESARRNPAIWEWVRNEWIRYACLAPSDGKTYWYDGSDMVSTDARKGAEYLPAVSCSLQLVSGDRDNIPIHEIREDR